MVDQLRVALEMSRSFGCSKYRRAGEIWNFLCPDFVLAMLKTHNAPENVVCVASSSAPASPWTKFVKFHAYRSAMTLVFVPVDENGDRDKRFDAAWLFRYSADVVVKRQEGKENPLWVEKEIGTPLRYMDMYTEAMDTLADFVSEHGLDYVYVWVCAGQSSAKS